jgi:hypothetical protein
MNWIKWIFSLGLIVGIASLGMAENPSYNTADPNMGDEQNIGAVSSQYQLQANGKEAQKCCWGNVSDARISDPTNPTTTTGSHQDDADGRK